MFTQPCILKARIAHHRVQPKKHSFAYNFWYLVTPLYSKESGAYPLETLKRKCLFGVNTKALINLRSEDFATRKKSPENDFSQLPAWVLQQLQTHHPALAKATESIALVTLPRTLGYGFSPINFYPCFNKAQQLVGVLCAVNNTFGQHHHYICAHANPAEKPIHPGEWLHAKKVFHVSPFFTREGSYRFKFNFQQGKINIGIDHLSPAPIPTSQTDTTKIPQTKRLITTLSGNTQPYTSKNLLKEFLRMPVQGIRVMALIHWHALRIWLKGIPYVPKPGQLPKRFTRSH